MLIRGLAKVALQVNSVPDMIRMYSALGFLNYGFPTVEGGVNFFEDSRKVGGAVRCEVNDGRCRSMSSLLGPACRGWRRRGIWRCSGPM